MRILTVVGARPQFVKAAIVSMALREAGDNEEILVHTGQHFDHNMSDIFFAELGMSAPNHHLGIGGGRHGENTGRMIEAIERVLLHEKPDCVLVYGDTDSTLAAAIASTKILVPLVHVEAGLRSFNKAMPEEINRILTDHCAELLLAPSQQAVDNLTREGIGLERITLVGDVMYDAALHYAKFAKGRSFPSDVFSDYILCTLHRKENVDDYARLKNILDGLSASERLIIWPLHPRTRRRIYEFGLLLPANVQVIDPVGYLEMISLESRAKLILTDSGGVQKEAFFHRVPCITLREETEWMELVSAGVNRLVGAEADALINAMLKPFEMHNFDIELYGKGMAARQVAAVLLGSHHS